MRIKEMALALHRLNKETNCPWWRGLVVSACHQGNSS
jgi:hypothetical protein